MKVKKPKDNFHVPIKNTPIKFGPTNKLGPRRDFCFGFCEKEVPRFEDYCSKECFLKRKFKVRCLNSECSNEFYQWSDYPKPCSKPCYEKAYNEKYTYPDPPRERTPIKYEEDWVKDEM
jgi:hypothetical protein